MNRRCKHDEASEDSRNQLASQAGSEQGRLAGRVQAAACSSQWRAVATLRCRCCMSWFRTTLKPSADCDVVCAITDLASRPCLWSIDLVIGSNGTV